MAETTVFCEIMDLQIPWGKNLNRTQDYGKRKNVLRALREADEEFLWSSANILEIRIIHNILVCLSLTE